jgi:hypothetical protein
MAFGTLATRKNARLRLALSGTAGAGKSYSALLIAAHFGQKIGVMDSERGSSQKYAGAPGIPPFYPEDLQDKTVQEYIEKIDEAATAGVDVLIIDSYSHSWIGALETVDKMGGNKFSNGWKVVSPLVSKLVDKILSFPGHVICTLRSKAEFAVEQVNGKAIPRKLGMATVARDGTDYEFDVMLDLTPEGTISVSKTRCSALAGAVFTRDDTQKIAKTLKAWLSEGAPVSARDAMAERIRFAADAAALDVVKKDIAAKVQSQELSMDDRQALLPIYTARLAEFQA